MINDTQFEDIRPYRDFEFRKVMDNLLNSDLSDLLIKTVFPDLPVDIVKTQLRSINTINEFQEKVIYRVIQSILSKSSLGFTKSGLENLVEGERYLFISNHRDIILDPSLLNMAIVEQGFETAEIAIGDNLLQVPWVKDLARLNKSFIVKRNLPVRELVTAAKLLSYYIFETVISKNKSVWIAQREGRAKDGNDRTQPGVLNMLGLSASGSLKQHFIGLNILPVSLSYQLDPCDTDKVRSLYSIKFFGGYTKEQNEDNLAMRKGIMGQKGKIHIHFGKPIANEISLLDETLHKNELIQQISIMIDRQIIGNYKVQSSNLISYDLLNEKPIQNAIGYAADERDAFLKDIEEKIKDMAGDPAELKSIFLEMYARPYLNKLEVSQL